MLALPGPADAALIYATSVNSTDVFTVNTVTHAVTPVFNAGVDMDSLFFDPSGRIVYSALNNGLVGAFNPVTLSNSNLATGLNAPIDMALEPSLTSFLVSDSSSHLVRISLSGSGVITSLNVGSRPDGIIYDNTGRLFVNVGCGFTCNGSVVEQINPITGAVIQTTGDLGVFLDGLTFDPSTGKLFASDYNNGRIVELDPGNLAAGGTFLTPTGAALNQNDGVVSDGLGNLYIASRGNSEVVQYDIATNAAIDLASINGIDDLAPVSGLGSTPGNVPEPSDLPLLAMGLAAITWLRRKFV